MSGNGFDTWILEVRGAGLSALGLDLHKDNQPFSNMSENITSSSGNHGQKGVVPRRPHSTANFRAFADSDISYVKRRGTSMVLDQLQLMTKLRKTCMPLSGRLSNFVNDGWSRNFLLSEVINFFFKLQFLLVI